MKVTKKQIAAETVVTRLTGNVFHFGYETREFLFTSSGQSQRVVIENKKDGDMCKQYGDAITKKEFVNNVYEYLTEVAVEN